MVLAHDVARAELQGREPGEARLAVLESDLDRAESGGGVSIGILPGDDPGDGVVVAGVDVAVLVFAAVGPLVANRRGFRAGSSI